MTKKILRTIKRYPYQAAGRTWQIPDVQIEASQNGTEVLPGREVTRMNEYIVHKICCDYSELTGEELAFLCDLTTTKYTEVASKLGVTKSIVSKWVAKGKEKFSLVYSIILKKYFWAKVFDTKHLSHIELSLAFDDEKLFNYMKIQIIQCLK